MRCRSPDTPSGPPSWYIQRIQRPRNTEIRGCCTGAPTGSARRAAGTPRCRTRNCHEPRCAPARQRRRLGPRSIPARSPPCLTRPGPLAPYDPTGRVPCRSGSNPHPDRSGSRRPLGSFPPRSGNRYVAPLVPAQPRHVLPRVVSVHSRGPDDDPSAGSRGYSTNQHHGQASTRPGLGHASPDATSEATAASPERALAAGTRAPGASLAPPGRAPAATPVASVGDASAVKPRPRPRPEHRPPEQTPQLRGGRWRRSDGGQCPRRFRRGHDRPWPRDLRPTRRPFAAPPPTHRPGSPCPAPPVTSARSGSQHASAGRTTRLHCPGRSRPAARVESDAAFPGRGSDPPPQPGPPPPRALHSDSATCWASAAEADDSPQPTAVLSAS